MRLFRNLIYTCLFFLTACSPNLIDETENAVQNNNKIRLEFFSPKVETVEIFDELIHDFERENADIDIEQIIIPNGMEVLKKRIARSQAPDIFITYPLEQDYVIRAEKGYLLELTQEDFIQNINPTIQNRYLVHGKMYGVALTQNAVGVLYNKEIFEQLHLEVPQTWDEFIQVLEAVKSAGVTPILMPNKDADTTSVFNLNLVSNEFDSQYWDQVNQGKVKISGDSKWMDVAGKMLKVVSFAPKDSFETDYEQANRGFAEGSGAMYVTGTWALSFIEKWNPHLKYGIFPFPASNDPLKNRVLGGVDIGLAISKDTRHPEAAKEFLKFLVKKENAQRLSDYEGSISAVQGVTVKKTIVQPLVELVQNNKNVNWPNHYWVGGTQAERDYRRYSQQFFMDKDIGTFLRHLDQMFAFYREEFKSYHA
ncbi:extracellular solute-binding protein [Cohnella sp. CFH 77786]|uniref:ABC transporter substrate-binding protein n=1 Tax=Cohnella sp. CFH 77786 TaxID=2662265 RepID=UPI001C60937D|nr:extracellular solute-binding protein [Cohnella sp. CFH 77786]MBW5448220.1 extracellular solute-binding protein [Cohnella sp. CFH 77786]